MSDQPLRVELWIHGEKEYFMACSPGVSGVLRIIAPPGTLAYGWSVDGGVPSERERAAGEYPDVGYLVKDGDPDPWGHLFEFRDWKEGET